MVTSIINNANCQPLLYKNLLKTNSMKKIKTLLLFICLTTTFLAHSQFRSDNIGGYIFSMRVDSSNNYIIGEQPSKTERANMH